MSIVKNSPEMNIVNQINAALNDVRASLVELSRVYDVDAAITVMTKARYQLDLTIDMVMEHGNGKSIAWSDRKPQVEEEFS